MELDTGLGDRGRLTRILLAGALAVAAIASFRRGKRVTGALTAAGALALGYATVGDVPDSIGVDETDEGQTKGHAVETTTRDNRMRCGACGEDITVGQGRRPNEDHETVHEACLEAAT